MTFPEGAEGSVDSPWGRQETTGPLRNIVSRLVANPQDLDRFAAKAPERVPGPEAGTSWTPLSVDEAPGSKYQVRMPVAEDAIFRVSGADLESSGIPTARISPSRIHLMLNGRELPLLYVPTSSGGDPARTGIASDDLFVFRGLQNDSKYSTTNVYWLVADTASPALPMAKVVEPPAGAPVQSPRYFKNSVTVEEDNPPVLTRNDQFLTILDYRWVWWTWTSSPSPALPSPRGLDEPGTVNFDLPGLASEGTTLSLRAHFYSHSWPNTGKSVVVRARVNGGDPVELVLTSQQDVIKDFEVPAAGLLDRGNSLVLELADPGVDSASAPADGKAPRLDLCFDRLEIDYERDYTAGTDGLAFSSPADAPLMGTVGARRQLEYEVRGVDLSRKPVVLDVTETAPLLASTAPDVAAGSLRFRAAESTTRSYVLRYLSDLPIAKLEPLGEQPNLRASSNRADYIIIAHSDFLETMKPFAEAKREAGHAVALLDVHHIYDQYAAGQETPEAIRAFLRHAVTNWQGSESAPAASAVLLVGDCTSAYRGQFRNGIRNYVPTYSESGWTESDRYASDLWFAQVCGDDLLADILIGRFSVNNVKDLQAILDKQALYVTRSTPGPWRNTLAYVADHSEFEGAVDRVMQESVPSAFFQKRIRMADEPWTDNYYFPAEIAEAKKAKVSPSTTTRIRDMFNTGAAMVTYFGHGSPNIWSNERIWFGGDSDNSDNLMLHNAGKYPLIINMTCNSGAIDYPMPKWNICISEDFMRIPEAGAIACYVPSGPGITTQHEKLTMELNRSLLDERVNPLGAAVTLGSWRYLLSGNPPDLVRMFILLGDPMLELDLPSQKVAPASDLQQWLSGSETDPCRKQSPPVRSGNFAQIVRQEGETYAATDILPLDQAPVVVTRPCPEDASGECGEVPCAQLPPRVESTASDAALRSGAVAAVLHEENNVRHHLSVPVGAVPEVTIRSWKVESDGVAQAGRPARLIIAAENTGAIPIRDAILNLKSTGPNTKDGLSASRSLGHHLLPGESHSFVVKILQGYGIHHYEAELLSGKAGMPGRLVSGPEPLVVAVAPASGDEDGKATVLLDPESVNIRWTSNTNGAVATVWAAAYNVTTYGAGDLVAGLVTAEGNVFEDTLTTISSIAPGQKGQIEIRRAYSGSVPPGESLLLRLDPENRRPDYARAPAVPLQLGTSTMSDLVIPERGIRPSDPTPTDGETVFFDVDILNRGQSPAEKIKVTAFDGVTTDARPLESRISGAPALTHLDPGESQTVRLRWDPFRNAGEHRIRIRASAGDSPDRNPADNERIIPLRVRTKYDLRKGPVAILPLSEEDNRNRQIRVIARVYNQGESPAHGVRVIVYPTLERNPRAAMGDLILDEVPPQSHRDAVLTYKLKPGEETFPFTPSFDAFLKGSLQRATQVEESAGQPARTEGSTSVPVATTGRTR